MTLVGLLSTLRVCLYVFVSSRPKKASSHHSDHCCRDFARIVFVLTILIMLGAIGFLGFVYYKLNGEVEKLKTTQVELKVFCDPKGDIASKVNGAATAERLEAQDTNHKKDMEEFKRTFTAWRNKVL